MGRSRFCPTFAPTQVALSGGRGASKPSSALATMAISPLTARSNPDRHLAPLTSSSTRLKGAKSSFGCELNGKLKGGCGLRVQR